MELEIMNWNIQLRNNDWPIDKIQVIGDCGKDYIAINEADEYIRDAMEYDVETKWTYLGHNVWQCELPDGWSIMIVGCPVVYRW